MHPNKPAARVDNPIVPIPRDEITPGVVDLGKTSGECDHCPDIGLSRGHHDAGNPQNTRHPPVLEKSHGEVQGEVDLADAHVKIEDAIHPPTLNRQG